MGTGCSKLSFRCGLLEALYALGVPGESPEWSGWQVGVLRGTGVAAMYYSVQNYFGILTTSTAVGEVHSAECQPRL